MCTEEEGIKWGHLRAAGMLNVSSGSWIRMVKTGRTQKPWKKAGWIRRRGEQNETTEGAAAL
jgi:hypothetical protein